MRVDSPEVAQHVEMQRGGLDGLGPALAQPVQMPFGGGKLGIAQQRLLGKKFAGFVDVARVGVFVTRTTAATLGIGLLQTLLTAADEVID